MTVDVVYITYRKDLSWICYSMQLLYKHLRGAFGVIVRAEENCKDVINTWGLPVKYYYTEPWSDGYAFAMYQKLIADQYSQADVIMLLDSDHILLEPAHIDDFLDQGKPIVRYRNWDEDPNDSDLTVGQRIWSPPIERTMGMQLDKNYMVGPPFMFWRETFTGVRTRVEEVTGLPFHDAIYSDAHYDYKKFLQHPMKFCDYEALGLYAAKFEPDRYVLKPHLRGAPWPFRVYWSHGDWTPNLQAKLDALLAA
jgi:hypothetical protein